MSLRQIAAQLAIPALFCLAISISLFAEGAFGASVVADKRDRSISPPISPSRKVLAVPPSPRKGKNTPPIRPTRLYYLTNGPQPVRNQISATKTLMSTESENSSTAPTQLPSATPVNDGSTTETPEHDGSPAPETAKPVESNESAASGTIGKSSATVVRSQADPELQATRTVRSFPAADREPVIEKSTANVVQPLPAASQREDGPEPPIGTTLPAVAANDMMSLNEYAVQLTTEARYEEAARLLKRALGLAPNTYVLHRNLSIVYESMRRMDEALAAARKAVELAPAEPSALLQLCGLELITGQNAGAVTCYERLLAISPLDTTSQTFYGVALLRSQRSSEAIAPLQKALAAEPSNAVILNAIGAAHFSDGEFESAALSFKRGVEISPEHGEIRFNLALTHLALGNREAAISQYRILKEEDPKFAKRLYRVLFRDKVVFLDKIDIP